VYKKKKWRNQNNKTTKQQNNKTTKQQNYKNQYKFIFFSENAYD
jgi:hypothetical protein